MTLTDEDKERFLGRVVPEPNTGCWLWLGAVDATGNYARFWLGTKTVKAHRVAWVMERGPIPDGMMLLHSCVGMRSCVNPAHLRIGTHRDNMDDRRRQGRAAFGKKNARHTHPESTARGERNGGGGKLRADDVREIRAMCASGVMRKEVARAYGVSSALVSAIVLGRIWRCVP